MYNCKILKTTESKMMSTQYGRVKRIIRDEATLTGDFEI